MSRKDGKVFSLENMLRNSSVFAFAWAILICSSVALYAGNIYYYVDKKGVWHFTNIKTEAHYRLYLKSLNKNADQHISDYKDMILKAAKSFGIEPALIKAIIKSGSDFNRRALSIAGAMGLMQLMPGTAKEMKVSNPMDPEENIFGGARYLSILINQFNDLALAVAAYNAGPKNVEHFQGIPPFPETVGFVRRVMKYYRIYKTQTKK